MYPALKKNIVIVKGHEASGIYNLNLGTFQRVSHDAGDFLYNNLNGQLHMIEFQQEVQDFITEAFKMDLIDFHPFKKLTNPTILSSGEVTPCLMIRDQKFSLGSTNNSSLKNILRSPSRSDFDQKMKIDNIPDCNGCEARYICKAGGCPATALAFKNSINVKNPLYSNCYYQNTETIADIENLKN